ncbi:MAG: TlpA family protein disulfide reductase [Acidimicrobiia bacterium]|nr:TlpA family protein disulfide reductase [Acidimicrobiia bacterium]
MSNRPRRVNPQPARLQAREGQGSESGRSRWLVWGGLAAVVLIAVVVGVAVAQTSSDSGSGIETGFAELIGQPLPPHDGTPTGVGQPAPLIRAQLMEDGAVAQVDTDDGTVRLIGFFAHWCPHCQREVPRVSSWLTDNELPGGVEVVAVSTSVEPGGPNYPPSAWFEREDWPTPVMVDSEDSAVWTGYGSGGFPYWVMVDGDGTVLEQHTGELDDAQFSAMVERAGSAAAA